MEMGDLEKMRDCKKFSKIFLCSKEITSVIS